MPDVHESPAGALTRFLHNRSQYMTGRDRPARTWRQARMTRYRQGRKPLHDYLRSHARSTPDKPAIIWYGQRISYAEVDRLSDRFAQCLHERGIAQGDVIVLFLHNC